MKAILRAATLLIMLLICNAPCAIADDVLVAQIAPDPSPAPMMGEEPAPDMSAMPTVVPVEPQGAIPEPSDTSAIVPKPEPIPSAEPPSVMLVELMYPLSPDSPPPLEPEHAPELATESMYDPSLTPALDPLSSTPGEDDPEEAQDGQGDGTGLVLTRNKPRLDWTGVVPAKGGGMPIPRLYQYNYKTVLCNYDGIPRSVMTSGCNVTCVAMVVAYLTGAEHSPEKLFSWALRNNLYHGNGLGHSEMSKVAAKYSVRGKWIARDGDAVIEALKAGKPVIAHMAPGLFATSGHYIVLRGVTEDGKILVNDPGSATKSKLAYPLKIILRETRTGSPFMVCEVK